jgi:peptidoglycan/LPS O-acetylase OafA/YrhL
MSTINTSRIPSLDGLRALSIALVIISHLAGTTNFPFTPEQIQSTVGEIGNLGVRVFFVISGFLITTLLMHEHSSTGRISLWQFYARRTIRIFPAAYFFLLVVCLLDYFDVLNPHPWELLRAFTYTSNYGETRSEWLVHLWSLSVEEQFYLIWPSVFMLLGPANAKWFALMQVLLAPIIRVIYWFYYPGGRDFGGFETAMDSIALGCLLALCRTWLHANYWYTAAMKSRLWLGAVVIMATMMVLAEKRFIFFITRDVVLNFCIAFIVDRAVTHSESGTFNKLLNLKPIAYVGTLSYSLYLWQELFTLNNSSSPIQSFPVNILCAIVVALFSYYLIERPALRQRNNIIKFIQRKLDT